MIGRLVLRVARTRESKVVIAAALVSAAHLLLIGPVPLPGGRGTLLLLEWTVTALCGVGYSAWFMWDCLVDLDVLRSRGRNGDTEIAALVLIIAALLLLVVHLLFFELGLPGLLSPPSPATATSTARVLGTEYTVVGQLLVYGLSLIHRLRGRLLAAYVRRSR